MWEKHLHAVRHSVGLLLQRKAASYFLRLSKYVYASAKEQPLGVLMACSWMKEGTEGKYNIDISISAKSFSAAVIDPNDDWTLCVSCCLTSVSTHWNELWLCGDVKLWGCEMSLWILKVTWDHLFYLLFPLFLHKLSLCVSMEWAFWYFGFQHLPAQMTQCILRTFKARSFMLELFSRWGFCKLCEKVF